MTFPANDGDISVNEPCSNTGDLQESSEQFSRSKDISKIRNLKQLSIDK